MQPEQQRSRVAAALGLVFALVLAAGLSATHAATAASAPYSAAWDSKIVTDGSHTLQVKALDLSGAVGSSSIVTVTVKNTVESTPPAEATPPPQVVRRCRRGHRVCVRNRRGVRLDLSAATLRTSAPRSSPCSRVREMEDPPEAPPPSIPGGLDTARCGSVRGEHAGTLNVLLRRPETRNP